MANVTNDEPLRSLTGRLVQKRWRVGRLVGSGMMGDVYEAIDEAVRHGHRIAIKFLHPSLLSDADSVARFEREAVIAANITSRFVAGVYGAGTTRDGLWWIALEWLEGESLEARLARTPLLRPADIGRIIANVLEGLGAAHEAKSLDGRPLGIVHRDIKPANIWLERASVNGAPDAAGERARILDFGISKLDVTMTGNRNPHLTSAGTLLGSVAYMAPEQAGNAHIDARADLFAVGVVTFLLLSGELPFPGGSTLAVLTLKREYGPRKLLGAPGAQWLDVEWIDRADRWLARMMARQAVDRFPSASAALDAWMTLLPIRAATAAETPIRREDEADTEVTPPAARFEPAG